MSGSPTLLDHIADGRTVRDDLQSSLGADSVKLQTNTTNGPDLVVEFDGFTDYASLDTKRQDILNQIMGLPTLPQAISYSVNYQDTAPSGTGTPARRLVFKLWWPEPLP